LESPVLTDFFSAVIAGFFTGGSLAVRGGVKAARNSAIMCAVFLAVIEGVGIGFQRMMADNTKLEVWSLAFAFCYDCN
jgi:import inner membrane translocase subunit TIM17